MTPSPPQGSSGVKSWARVQFFRLWTALATLVLLGLCFFYYPEWLQWYLRAATRRLESASDLLPSPWAARTEVVLRTVGASFWFQIAAAIVLFRVLMWLIGAGARAMVSRWQPEPRIEPRLVGEIDKPDPVDHSGGAR